MADANDYQKASLEAQKRLQKDIRPMIARSGMYNPENDPEYVFQPFPEAIKLPNGREVIVNNQEEKDSVLGIKPIQAKKVEVNVAEIVKEQQAAPAPRRGRPPKAKSVDLPPDLG